MLRTFPFKAKACKEKLFNNQEAETRCDKCNTPGPFVTIPRNNERYEAKEEVGIGMGDKF